MVQEHSEESPVHSKTDFSKIMEIFEDYQELDEEDEEPLQKETNLEKELFDENEFLDKLLSGQDHTALEEIKPEITIHGPEPAEEITEPVFEKPKPKKAAVQPLEIEVKKEEIGRASCRERV